jgi:ATP-dependent helicase HrpA
LPLYAWPGLQFEEGAVNLRLFRSQDAARDAGAAGLQRLVELVIQRDLGWLEKDLRGLNRFDALYAPLGPGEELRETALEHLKRHILPAEPLAALSQAHFQAAVDEARRRLPGLVQQLSDRLAIILPLRQQARQRLGSPAVAQTSSPARSQTFSDLSQLAQPAAPGPANSLANELAALMPPRFLEHVSFDRLAHLPRYLKALLLRAERAALNPGKNQERLRQLAPYEDALKKLTAQARRTSEARRELETFRWMVEEFKVSIFAQELGTAMPVSPKRLNQQLERIHQA